MAITSTRVATDCASVSTPLPARTADIRWEFLSVQSTAILRQVVAPLHLDGYKTTDVATRLGIPPGSVKLLTAYFASEVSELGASRRLA